MPIYRKEFLRWRKNKKAFCHYVSKQFVMTGNILSSLVNQNRFFMKKRLFILQFLFFAAYCSSSQSVGIGTTTPDPSAALDITATNKGLLIPRMNINSVSYTHLRAHETPEH